MSLKCVGHHSALGTYARLVDNTAVLAAIYTRISRNAGLGDQLGVTRQREDCEALARRKGWEVVGVYEDNDISAQ